LYCHCPCKHPLTQWLPPHKINAVLPAELATLGGGCFWCVEACLTYLHGVKSVVSGYAGGHVPNPTYEQVRGPREQTCPGAARVWAHSESEPRVPSEGAARACRAEPCSCGAFPMVPHVGPHKDHGPRRGGPGGVRPGSDKLQGHSAGAAHNAACRCGESLPAADRCKAACWQLLRSALCASEQRSPPPGPSGLHGLA
jgi:hypothetical protein